MRSDGSAPALVAAADEIADTFGLELGRSGEVPDDVAARARSLDGARQEKDYAAADAIRAGLQADGWTVETTKDGTTVRR